MKENQENFFQRDLPERMTEWCSLNCKDKGRNSGKSERKKNMISESMVNKMDSPSPLEMSIMFEDWGKN